jgi:hypothetical protein
MSSTKKALGRRRLLKTVGGAVGAAAAAGSLGVVLGESVVAKPRSKTRKPSGETGTEAAKGELANAEALQVPADDAPAEVVSPAHADGALVDSTEPAPPSEAVRAMFGRLREGDVVGTCTIVAIHDVLMGAVPVVLETRRGHRFQVDILRRDHAKRSPAGVANTRAYSFYLSNGGSGGTKTREEMGLGVIALATALRGRAAAAPGELLTLRQRHSRFPQGWFVVTA